jgi:hypothetical protein
LHQHRSARTVRDSLQLIPPLTPTESRPGCADAHHWLIAFVVLGYDSFGRRLLTGEKFLELGGTDGGHLGMSQEIVHLGQLFDDQNGEGRRT